MPEVHDALCRAVGAHPARRRWWQPTRRAGLLALGTLIASGSAFAATGAWHPILGDDHRGHPQPADAAIPADQVATLAVLRRPQTDRDRGPDVQAILSLLVRGEINGLHTDGIRVLRRHSYGATILVPVERVGRHDPGYPSGIRRQVLCVFSGVTTAPATATVIRPDGRRRTIRTGGGLRASEVCGDLKELRTRGIQQAGTRIAHRFVIGGLVPDGVARVIVRLRHERVVSAAVRDNFYELTAASDLAPGRGVRWLDRNGHSIHPGP